MSSTKDYRSAREHMERMLRAEQHPEPRWDVIERELFARIERPEPARGREPLGRPALLRAFGFAAIAAAIALGLVVAGRPSPSVTATATPARARDLATVPAAADGSGAIGDLDLRALQPGDVVETAASSASFRDGGAVRWTLLPNSRAEVRAAGAAGRGHLVALERGAVRAEVAPRAPEEGLVEAFSVEVDGTRVAVHGTIFTVTRLSDRVEVDVERGTVAVGPAGYRGATTARLLVAPSRGEFSLDGGSLARLLPRAPQADGVPSGSAAPEPALASRAPATPREPTAAPPPRSHAADPVAAVAAETAAPAASFHDDGVEPVQAAEAPPAGAAPSTAAPAPAPEGRALLTPASVQAQLSRCFARERAGGSASAIRRSINSTLRISVRHDGSIATLRFAPPLKPALQACAEALYAGRFASGAKQIEIPLTLEE